METQPCVIVVVGKTRQGHARFWCTKHQAPAHRGAVRLKRCLAAYISAVAENDILRISPTDFPGGVAFWGAVPPVYDTTRLAVDFGIHVHARTKPGGQKIIDRTYQRVIFNDNAGHQHVINAEAAVYYMASLLFGQQMQVVQCTHCRASHLDKDWFSVHPHKKHLCAACGRDFFATEHGIGNPLMAVKEAYGDAEILRKTLVPERDLRMRQADYPGGLRIWASNQAIVLTAKKAEEEGVHVHGYDDEGLVVVDDTFRSATQSTWILATMLSHRMILMCARIVQLPFLLRQEKNYW